jgi:hypothetical protein
MAFFEEELCGDESKGRQQRVTMAIEKQRGCTQ